MSAPSRIKFYKGSDLVGDVHCNVGFVAIEWDMEWLVNKSLEHYQYIIDNKHLKIEAKYIQEAKEGVILIQNSDNQWDSCEAYGQTFKL